MESLYWTKNRIDSLKKRSNRCVCKYCGGPLHLRRIIFNDIKEARIEIFCDNCDRIEFGIEPEIYISARNFVENLEFNYFYGMDDNERTRKMNIAKVCDILSWGCKNMGFLTQEGFTVSPNLEKNDFNEFVVLSSDEISTEKTFDELLEEIVWTKS